MIRLRSTVLALLCGLFFFSSCSDFYAPVRAHLENYSTTVIVLDYEVLYDSNLDDDGVVSVPSADPAYIMFYLNNVKNYDIIPSLRFTNPAVQAYVDARPSGDSYHLGIPSGGQSVLLDLTSEFIYEHERGGDISIELTLTEQETNRVFPPHRMALRANSPPPAPTGILLMLDDADIYVVCFNLDLSSDVHQDFSRIECNGIPYLIDSVETGMSQGIEFATGMGGISTTEPAGIKPVPGLGTFASLPNNTQVYVTTGQALGAVGPKAFRITVYDGQGLSQSAVTSVTGNTLPPVEFQEFDSTPITDGSDVSLSAPAIIRLVSPVPGATVEYTVTGSGGAPSTSGTFTTDSRALTLESGTYEITALASMSGINDSAPSSITVTVVPQTLYIASWGNDENPGTSGSPMKNLSAAYDRLLNKNDSANTIVLMTDIVAEDSHDALAYLNIAEETQLRIVGNGNALDAHGASGRRGMVIEGGAFLELTLENLDILNGRHTEQGAGLYVNNINASVTLEGCTVRGNTLEASGSNAYGAGIYFRGSGLELTEGTSIESNHITNAESGNGAGVYVAAGTFATNNSTITLNTITGVEHNVNILYGAGLYCAPGGGATLTGGEISHNKIFLRGHTFLDGSGAGVYITGCTSELTGVDIIGNTIDGTGSGPGSTAYGAGVYVHGGTTTLTTCNITGNRTTSIDTSRGAGICLMTNSTLALESTTISGNEGNAFTGEGGGLYAGNGSTVNMTDGTITNNKAKIRESASAVARGDGVYITAASLSAPSTFTLNSGTIDGNASPEAGADTHTALYLAGQYATLVFGSGAVIQSANVVYIESTSTLEANEVLVANTVATLEFPSFNSTHQFLTGNPGANHDKFDVLPIDSNDYVINETGYLVPD